MLKRLMHLLVHSCIAKSTYIRDTLKRLLHQGDRKVLQKLC